MDSISGTASEETSARYQASCPYIGMVSDPQTHVGTPDSRNFCHLVNPPQEVMIGHQQGFCLGQHFSECPIYKSSGEDDKAEGVFEYGEKAGRGFGLFRFGRKSQAKPGKPDGNGPSSVAVPVAAAVIGAESISEPVVKPATPAPKQEPKQEPNPTKEPVPVAQSEPIPESLTDPGLSESGVPVDEDEELRMRLYNEALSRYEQVNSTKKDRKGFWIILMIAAIFVLLVSVWGIYTRSQNLLRQSQVEAEMSYTRSLATAVQDMGAASEAWGTAASIIEARDLTGTAVLFGTSTALQAGSALEGTAQASTAAALAAAAASQVGICQNISDAKLQVISGPTLSPAERTLYQPGLQSPQATWVIQNDGDCGWGQILLWSVTDNLITQPIVKRNGQLVIVSQLNEQSLIAPGEQIELILQFPASQAQRVFGEWVLVADGLSLVSQPHLDLKVDNWITLEQYVRPTSTRLVRKTPVSGGGSSPGTNPSDVPPNRETPVPPTPPDHQ